MKVLSKFRLDSYSKSLNLITVFFLFLVTILVFLNIFLIGYEKESVNIEIFEKNEINDCSLSKWQFSIDDNRNPKNKEIVYEAYDLNIYPEVNNFYCLGKVLKIDNTSNQIKITVGTNRFLFNFFNLIINSSLIILLLGRVTKDKYIGILFILFNCYNFYLFRSELTLLKSVFPYTNPQTYNEIFFFNIILLSLLIHRVKNNKIKIIFIYLLVFFIPDYIGLFIIFVFLVNENFIDINNKVNKRLINFLPVAFYLLRTLYSFSSYFDDLWMLTGQRVYHGVSRFYDGIWNFEAMACIKNPNIFDGLDKKCRELSGGILDDYLYITTEPYITTLIFMAIMHLIMIFIYFDVLKRFNFNQLLVSLLIVSPPFNFLTFQGNFDILYFVLSYFTLTKLKKYNFAVSIIFFTLSLYKLHALGAVFGLILYFIRQNNKKFTYINFVFFSVSFYFALLEILNNKIVYGFGRFEYSYGLLNLSNMAERYLGINEYFIFALLLLLILSFIITNSKNNVSKIHEKYYEGDLFFNVYTYWFLFTLVTVNNAYRLPIFFLLLLIYLESKSKLLKFSGTLFIFLSVVPVTNYLIFIYLLGLIKYLSMILLITLILLFEYKDLSKIQKKFDKYKMVK